MRKLVTGAGVVAVAVAATLASATPASAADTPRNEGAACIQAGLGTLKSLGLLQAAAQTADRLQHPGRPGHRAHLRRLACGQLPIARTGREAPQDQPRAVRLVRLSLGA